MLSKLNYSKNEFRIYPRFKSKWKPKEPKKMGFVVFYEYN